MTPRQLSSLGPICRESQSSKNGPCRSCPSRAAMAVVSGPSSTAPVIARVPPADVPVRATRLRPHLRTCSRGIAARAQHIARSARRPPAGRSACVPHAHLTARVLSVLLHVIRRRPPAGRSARAPHAHLTARTLPVLQPVIGRRTDRTVGRVRSVARVAFVRLLSCDWFETENSSVCPPKALSLHV